LETVPLTLGNIAFQGLSLTVLGVFCWMIYTFRAQAAECLGRVVAFSDKERGGIEHKRLYDRFTGIAMTLGALSAGLGAVKVAAAGLAAGTGTPGTWQWALADLAGTDGIAGMPRWIPAAAALAVALVVVGIVLVGVGVLKAAGGVTLSGKFVTAIVQTKRKWLAAASMLAVPLVAVWTGINPVRDTVVAYLIAGVVVILFVLFALHTLRGFLKQNVSLLVWFLYLCTVELIPVCAVALAAAKNV
jgi:hypothetical protein